MTYDTMTNILVCGLLGSFIIQFLTVIGKLDYITRRLDDIYAARNEAIIEGRIKL